VWRSDELAGDPHGHSAKAQKVRSMFASIAGSYDLNNRVHSFGRDQAWRRAAVRAGAVEPGESEVLDVACGTGDLTRAFADAGARRVVGLDYTPEMLDVARAKRLAARGGGANAGAGAVISYEEGDAMSLPHEDGAFDIVSIAFGIRNVADPVRALSEFRRVLRPGGRLVVLEFDSPRFGPARWASRVYTERVMPWTATLIAGDRSGAYRYLPRSVSTFLSREEMVAAIGGAGFGEVTARPLTFGVAVVYRGVARAG
jgi:demethylmenaquinone methyltransferase/2-methoxy-6-polyprenyl-1,4-benzoquinol methylase